MRKTNQWWRPLYDELKSSLGKTDLPDSVPTLFKVECGLWLSGQLNILPDSLWAIIGMADFIDAKWNNKEQRMISIARYYLNDDRHSWRNALELYRNFEPELRLYDLSEDLATVSLVYPPSAHTLKRDSFYSTLLTTPPNFQEMEKNVATVGRSYRYKVKTQDKLRVTRDVFLPKDWETLNSEWSMPAQDQRNILGQKSRVPLKVPLAELTEIACFLDLLEQASQQTKYRLNKSKWEARLKNINIRLFDHQGQLINSDEIVVDGITHLPGTLSAGKSTLAFLLAIWCAINNRQITIILNDVSSILSMANDLNQRLLHPLVVSGGISLPGSRGDPRPVDSTTRGSIPKPKAVPILGRTSRGKHISQLYQDTFEEALAEHRSHAFHWGWRWLDTNCALDAFSSDAGDFHGPIPQGQEPCESLMQIGNNNEELDSSLFMCPLMGNCPVHQAARDLIYAPIWVTSPAALISSFVSRAITKKRMSYYELVYRVSDVVIVDECDQAQSTLDGLFLPDTILAGPGQGHLLNDLAQRVAQMRNDRRSLHENSSRRWVRAVEIANSVTDQIYDILTSPSGGRIRGWIGDGIFWNMNLFALLIWEIMGAKEDEASIEQHQVHTQWLNRFARFTSAPLQSEEWETDKLLDKLGRIVQVLISSGHSSTSKRKCIEWVEEARGEKGINYSIADRDPRLVDSTSRGSMINDSPSGDIPKDVQYWDSLAGRLEFALLVSILDDQLTLVELDWGSAPGTLNLDSYSILRDRDKELRPVLPPPPTGRIFGFQYKREKFHPGVEGILRRIRFPAMGRWALLHFHDLFLASDGIVGPHQLLLSGTSWSPLSPFFHVNQPPVGVLETLEQKQNVSEWFFKPASLRGKTLSISGAQGDRRQFMLEQVSIALAQPGGSIDQMLALIRTKAKELEASTNNLWLDRERILVLTGSYDEAANVASTIHQAQSKLQVCQMIRSGDDQEDENEQTWISLSTQKVGHADVNRFAVLYPEAKVLVAPIDAIGRGRNILNKNGVAAFGCIVFVIRSLLPPNDPAADARRLMFWTQNELPVKIDRAEFGEKAQLVRQSARDEWYRLLTNRQTWVDMGEVDRDALSSTLFTRMWQAVGRGIRGGVPVVVLFVDAKWAPESANGKTDTPQTSLLMSMHECYDAFLGKRKGSAGDQQLAEVLYAEPIYGLDHVQGLTTSNQEECNVG